MTAKPAWLRHAWDWLGRKHPALVYEINLRRRYHRYEPDLWAIPRFTSADTVSVDVGANAGIFSRWMSKHSRQVHSFECNPHLLDHLRRVNPSNVVLHACALSSAAGQAQLRFDPENSGIGTIETRNRLDQNAGVRHIVQETVPLHRLDEFALDDVSFVKIDVEGHELEVLKGATDLIERCRPTFLIEIEERHCAGNLDAVPSWLTERGYGAYALEANGSFHQVHDLKSRAPDWNNFWFVHASRSGQLQ